MSERDRVHAVVQEMKIIEKIGKRNGERKGLRVKAKAIRKNLK